MVLLDRETSYAASLEIRPGGISAKELTLDLDREIADPAGDPDEVVIGAHGRSISIMTAGPFPYSSWSRRRKSSSTTVRS